MSASPAATVNRQARRLTLPSWILEPRLRGRECDARGKAVCVD